MCIDVSYEIEGLGGLIYKALEITAQKLEVRGGAENAYRYEPNKYYRADGCSTKTVFKERGWHANHFLATMATPPGERVQHTPSF